MRRFKFLADTRTTLLFNFAFAVGHCALGFAWHSWWYITLGSYYALLSIMRFSSLQVKRKSKGDRELEKFVKRITGILFLLLSLCLIGVVILSAVESKGTKHNQIVMITIALYAFTKVTLAIINLVKSKKSLSPVTKTLRNISFADAFVSVFSLQRSMLVTFEGMTSENIILFNILTGSAVCILIFLLGINLIGGRGVDMAKSKIIKANQKIADAVVGGYKKIENAVVGGYTKIEDKFVDAYLTKEGETVEEAKKRLKK